MTSVAETSPSTSVAFTVIGVEVKTGQQERSPARESGRFGRRTVEKAGQLPGYFKYIALGGGGGGTAGTGIGSVIGVLLGTAYGSPETGAKVGAAIGSVVGFTFGATYGVVFCARSGE
ncbi:hypothetical protein [Endozoicomonas sp.]|uniref:hypothetical protein n=1 Tax=Endozoicomonas sp. TaxID=1892382 RepID=UPI002884B952|nr:hypothetical protein [Endozoicomonas sp.]